jgi:hypothetical protein
LFTAAVLLGITWITFSRLLSEGIADHVYLFGRETLRAVQALGKSWLFCHGRVLSPGWCLFRC